MNKYTVRIRATVVKDIVVEAEDAEQADELAHEEFTAACDGTEESYTEEVESVEEVAA